MEYQMKAGYNKLIIFSAAAFVAVAALLFLMTGQTAKGADVVIEPGHGTVGVSDGAYNALYNLHESDVNLAIGLKLNTLLQQAGYQSLMTRYGNVVMSEPAIDNLINTSGAAACISIHCNAGGGNGTETYYSISPPKNPADTRDRILAENIQSSVVSAIRSYPYIAADRGVKTANFYIRNYTPPSILTEVLFIDNNTEAWYLAQDQFQWKVAEGIFNGITQTIPSPWTPSPAPASPPSYKIGESFPLLYDYGNGTAGIWTIGRCAASSPTIWPTLAWNSSPSGFDAARSKVIAGGDFDGDTNLDTAVLYDCGNATSELWLFLNNQGNGNLTPVRAWRSSSGGFDANRGKMTSGDFGGDNKSDIAILYDYGGSTTGIWTFISNGTAMTPNRTWLSDTWDASRSKITSGNFNGAGPDDVAILYDYGGSTTGIWTFISNGTAMTPNRTWLSGPGHFNTGLAKITSGNFNGAGPDDVAVLYDYGGSTTGIWTFISNGTAMTPNRTWLSGPGHFNAGLAKIAGGNFGGDTKSDVAVLYDYGNACSGIFDFISSGASMTPNLAWCSGYRSFDAGRAKMESSATPYSQLGSQRPVIQSPLNGGLVNTTAMLGWSSIPGATSYEVEILNAPPEAEEINGVTNSAHRVDAAVSSTNSLAYTTSGLTASTRYYYRVIARDGSGPISTYSFADFFRTWAAAVPNRGFPLMYNYRNSTSAILSMVSSGGSTPTITQLTAWASGLGCFDMSRSKTTSGDFDGDGNMDVAVLYDYDNSTSGLFFFLNNQGNGSFTPVQVWLSGPGNFDANRSKITSGNFGGDAKSDIAILYDYGGFTAGIWTFISNGTSVTLNRMWYSGAGDWDANRSKITSGNFGGDAKSDIAILYDYGNSTTGVWTFISNGTTMTPNQTWLSNTWDASLSKITSGNFGGDNKDDVAILYDYGGSSAGLWTLLTNGASMSANRAWQSSTFNADLARIVSGDFGGDTRLDVALLYDYGGSVARIFTLITADAGMNLNQAWQSAAFDATRAKLQGDPGMTYRNITLTASGAFDVRDSNNIIRMSLTSGQNVSVGYSLGNYYVAASSGQFFVTRSYVRLAPVGVSILQVGSMPSYNRFRGVIEIRYSSVSSKLWAINELDMQSYMKGMGEEPESHPVVPDSRFPEFLKLAAVAIRSYAYDVTIKQNKHPGEPFDLCNSPSNCQWYIGYERETWGPKFSAAVDNTYGEVITYGGQAARTPYFSDCGGATATNSSYPWCVGKTDEVCAGHTPSVSHHSGICMDGARRRVAAGADYHSVLSFYYTGIGFGSFGNPAVRVGVFSITP